jgi:hypothetical protein
LTSPVGMVRASLAAEKSKEHRCQDYSAVPRSQRRKGGALLLPSFTLGYCPARLFSPPSTLASVSSVSAPLAPASLGSAPFSLPKLPVLVSRPFRARLSPFRVLTVAELSRVSRIIVPPFCHQRHWERPGELFNPSLCSLSSAIVAPREGIDQATWSRSPSRLKLAAEDHIPMSNGSEREGRRISVHQIRARRSRPRC